MTGWNEPLEAENFENILRAIRPTLLFVCRRNAERFRDLDGDDLYQLFSIKLWKLLSENKLPSDMNTCDYRFRRYCQTVFTMEVNALFRKKVNAPKYRNHGVIVYKDYADCALPFDDSMAIFIGD